MFKHCRTLLMLAALTVAVAPGLMAQGPAPTNFGSIGVNSSTSQTITFTVASTASFSLQYGNGSEFTIGTPSCSGGNCAVPVTFSPIYPGLRAGAIIATDQTGNLLATGLVYGIGLGPQLAIGPGVISTVANRASTSLTSATLSGVAVALGGNVYVADDNNNVVLAVNTGTGQVTTYAGNTTRGYTGDGGLALNAQLNSPSGLAFDRRRELVHRRYGEQCHPQGERVFAHYYDRRGKWHGGIRWRRRGRHQCAALCAYRDGGGPDEQQSVYRRFEQQ